MQRNPAQPSHLRRRYQAFQHQKQRNGFKSSTTDTSLDGPDGLELSMHLPKESSRNRFEALTPLSHASDFSARSQDARPHPRPRRYRHSRGTKEAKRRRDARRNRRKLLAAHGLDAELSDRIDKALDAANIYRPPQLRLPAPKPPSPVLTVVKKPRPIQIPSTPPQLPYAKFDRFDLLCDFSQVDRLPPSPAPSLPPLFMPQIPSWCPEIPSLADRKSSIEELPLFFDLSCLPESFQAPKPSRPRCQELQLWQPKVSPQPVKHSRFFPPRPTSPKPSVKLPTAYALHKNDKGVQVDLAAKLENSQSSIDKTERANKTSEPNNSAQPEASAANLWRILSSKHHTCKHVDADRCVSSFAAKHPQDRLSAPFGMFDTRMEAIGMPAELDNTEVSYAHANTLTGDGNERAQYPQREIEEHKTVIYDPPFAATATDETYEGLNEMVIDHHVCDEDEKRYWDT